MPCTLKIFFSFSISVLLPIFDSVLYFLKQKPRRRQWHPTPVLLPGKSHGRRSLEGCSPWGRWGSGTTERLHFHFSLSWLGEGNGNPLQCSCLENPRDRGAWWAAVYGVAQSRTRLKRLSSSSSKQKPEDQPEDLSTPFLYPLIQTNLFKLFPISIYVWSNLQKNHFSYEMLVD